MTASPIEPPQLAAWHAALAMAPALAAALGAALLLRQPHAAAWRRARGVAGLVLALAMGGLAALALAGGGQWHGVRVDVAGAIVATLVAFIGWTIVRFSQQYLAGEPGQAGYLRSLLATLAAVLVVIASNHLLVVALAWTATSLLLHRLLTFFGDRPAALVAAHKKFLLGRAADAAMFGACALLALEFGTLRLDALALKAAAVPTQSLRTQCAVLLVVLAAVLKCAQLPFHGWLIQVMEAPTPVSALLHAGVVNLGGFVMLRLAPLVAEVPAASALLVIAGTASAVVAALVMTTRISIKVALAWSTCAQMGFMLLQCGLGLWEMALLHLVAHSLYKAHAFLSAGGVVRQAQLRQLGVAWPAPGLSAQGLAAAAALGLAGAAAVAWGVPAAATPALWVAGGIVALALVPLLLQARTPLAWSRAAATCFVLASVYFGLHGLLQPLVAPQAAAPAFPWWALVGGAFCLLFVLQCVLTARPDGALARALYPWCYGGLFLDERFSHALFRRWPPPRPRRSAATAALPEPL